MTMIDYYIDGYFDDEGDLFMIINDPDDRGWGWIGLWLFDDGDWWPWMVICRWQPDTALMVWW